MLDLKLVNQKNVHQNNQDKSMGVNAVDILGTSALSLLNFKKQLQDKEQETNNFKTKRKHNYSGK